jgi:hypothetical protein
MKTKILKITAKIVFYSFTLTFTSVGLGLVFHTLYQHEQIRLPMLIGTCVSLILSLYFWAATRMLSKD